jgi:MFS family permease
MLSAFGIIGVGWLSDRFGRRQTATLSYLSTIIGIVALSLVTLFPSLLLVYAFVFFFACASARRAHYRRHGGQAVSWRCRAVYGTLSVAQGFGAARLLGLGPALRADRRLHRLVHAGHLRALIGLASLLDRTQPARG